MRKKIALTIISIAVVVATAVAAIGYASAKKEDSLQPFTYEIKDSYGSYAEVAAEKEAFFQAKDAYYLDLSHYLAKISKAHGTEYTHEVEDELQFPWRAIDYEDKLNEALSRFTPSESEKNLSLERCLRSHVESINEEPHCEGTSEHRKRATQALQRFEKGEISLDEALFASGTIQALIKRYSLAINSDSRAYHSYLSRFNMLTWFDLNEYLEEFNGFYKIYRYS